MYNPAVGRWNGVDALADSFLTISPFVYVANNPLKYIDPDGRTIWIYYQGEDGTEQRLEYKPGMVYNGENDFVIASIKHFDALSNSEVSKEVVERLVGSELEYNALDKKSPKGKYSLQQTESGGDFYLGGLVENTNGGESLDDIGVIGHELFHGYQRDVLGMYPNSIQNEVEAYLFGALVQKSFGVATTQISSVYSDPGDKYGEAASRLVYNGYNSKDFEIAVNNFKNGSTANARNRLYDKLPLRSKPAKSILIKLFLPVRK